MRRFSRSLGCATATAHGLIPRVIVRLRIGFRFVQIESVGSVHCSASYCTAIPLTTNGRNRFANYLPARLKTIKHGLELQTSFPMQAFSGNELQVFHS